MASSFASMTKAEMMEVADTFGVGYQERWGVTRIRAEVLAAGVTWDYWLQHEGRLAPEKRDKLTTTSVPFLKQPKCIVVMTRENPTFEVRGHKFTRDHPFVIMDSIDAAWVTHNVPGFRIATTQEAQTFYK